MSCTCSKDYCPLSGVELPTLMPPHSPENSTCYAVYSSAYYDAQKVWNSTISDLANIDPSCPDCVKCSVLIGAQIAFQLAAAEAEVAYWKCRAENG